MNALSKSRPVAIYTVANNNMHYCNIHCCGGNSFFKPALLGGLTGTSFKPAVEPGAGAGADILKYIIKL